MSLPCSFLAGDACMLVLGYLQPPDWLHAFAVSHRFSVSRQLHLRPLLDDEPVYDSVSSIDKLIDNDEIVRLWYLLQKQPSFANEGIVIDGYVFYPLHVVAESCAWNSKCSAFLLLQARAAVNRIDCDGETALHIASVFASVDVVRLLIHHAAIVNNKSRLDATPIHLAAQAGRDDVLTLLLDAKASGIDDPRRFDELCHCNATPLFLAAEINNIRCVQILLSNGVASVNVYKLNGQSALICAAQNGNRFLLRELLSVSSDDAGISQGPFIDGSFRCPLWSAIGSGCLNIVTQLIDHSANLNDVSPVCDTALIKAVRYGHEQILHCLLVARANNFDVGLGEQFFTALYLASSYDRADMVRQLLYARAMQPGAFERSPLQVALKHGNESIVKLLCEDRS